jgi:hypothetical protein
MKCAECIEKLVEYTEGLLPDIQKQEMEAHLKDCTQCRSELQEVSRLKERLTINSKSRQPANLEDAVVNRIIREQNLRLKQADKTSRQLQIWRNIMKSKMTKLAAAAAVIIIAVVLSITLLDKSTSSAYALEQTMKAYEGLRFVHMKDFTEGQSEPREFWVEFDEQEQVKNIRISLPGWAEREGPMVGIWNDGKMQVWVKKENGIFTKHTESFVLEIADSAKKFNPITIVKQLHQLETEGKAEIKTSEPKLKSEPIIMTAKILSPDSDAGNQLVLSIDQNTKMVTRVVFNKAKEFDGQKQTWEFSDYNTKVDESFFTLSEVPANVKRQKVERYDSAARYNPTEIGLVQGDIEDQKIAVELVRQFVQALIDKDYEKAGKLCGGTPADTAEKLEGLVENKTYKKILCIEQPTRDANSSTKAIVVPCVVAANYGGTMLVVRTNISVEPYMADPNRWVVDCNGIYKERPVITADPTDTTATFMENINAKLASLDINKSTVDNVIAVLGKPWAYRCEGKDLEKDKLPEAYTMDYPGNFIVSIYKNQVILWGSQQIPGHEIPGYIFSDSIQIGATLDDVFKKLGSPAKVVEGFDDGRHGSKQVMFEDNTIYANMKSNERKGFCFYRYDSNGEKIKVYFDDNVLYQNLNKTKGFCLYGTVSKGKRIRILSKDNKVFSLIEYRTEPIKNIE